MCVMKLNKYFMMGAMGLSLVACSDNLDENGQGANGTNPNEGTTYAALKINFESASSRVGELPVDGDEDGTMYDDDETTPDNETLVKDVRIVVIDANGNTEFNKVVTGVTDGTAKGDDGNLYIFQITPGEKTFYAVINGNSLGLSSELESWNGGELTLAKKASELCDYNASATEGKGFLMSSVEPVANVPIQDDIDIETVKDGTANNVEITVDRVVAKVTMQVKSNIDMDDQTATLKNLTCQIGNADNLKYDKDAAEDAKYTGAGTYLMAKDESGYRTTPYYEYALDASTMTNFNQSQLLSGTATSIYTNGAVSQTPARFYCLENTHAANNYLQSNTTFVRVAAEMIPNTALTLSYADNNVTVSNKETMPDVPGTFYVVTDAPDQSYNGSYVFESDLAAIYSDVVTEGQEQDQAAQAEAVIEALADDGYAFTDPYKDGVGYYNIWVNDLKKANGTYENIAPVFRNDWYDLTIQSIKLPGDPNPDIDPDQPIHPNTNVAVTLSIRKWNKVVYDDVVLQ